MTLVAPAVPATAAATGWVCDAKPLHCAWGEPSRGMLDPATGTTCAGDVSSAAGAVPQAVSASALAPGSRGEPVTARCFEATMRWTSACSLLGS